MPVHVVCVGDLMVDVVALLPAALAPGSDTPAPVAFRGGGAAANVAAWLVTAGARATFVGRVGDDVAGREAVRVLDEAGVRTSVAVDPHRPTGTCLVLVAPDGERTMVPSTGANSGAGGPLPDDADWLYVSGYSLLDPDARPFAVAALATARERGWAIAVDAASAAPLASVGTEAFLGWLGTDVLLFANEAEARVLTGQAEPAAAAQALALRTGHAVVKRGAAGAVWSDGGGVRSSAAQPVADGVVDTTGAGDAFAAGFLACPDDVPRALVEAACSRHGPSCGSAAARPDPIRSDQTAPSREWRLVGLSGELEVATQPPKSPLNETRAAVRGAVGRGRHNERMPRSLAPLVGRDAELAELLRTLDGAQAGTAGAVIVGGDAGMGKTRLLGEMTQAAQERGFRTLIGHCVDLGEAPPPYLPFSEAFARLSAEDRDVVDTLLTEFPAMARLLPGRATATEVDRIERGELFESVLGALGRLATVSAVTVLVEDLHWADQATRDLLGFLFTRLRRERLAILASFRSDYLYRRHPLRPVLAEWARLPAVSRIQLEPLGGAELRTLIRAIHPDPLPESDLASIVSRADGNAFFTEELVAATEQWHDAAHLPWQLADLLLVRLDRLSDDARGIVRLAAVAGRRVSHSMLAQVTDLPPRGLDDALRDAIDAHVLEMTSSGRGYVFRHALLAEAVYDDLLPGERVRLHAEYAAAMADDPGRSRAELARHALASHDLDTAYLASVAAGEAAMAVAAPQEALAHYEVALDVAPRTTVAPADRADLVLAFAEAAEGAGRWQRGVQLARSMLAELPPDASDESHAKLLYAMVRAALGEEISDETRNASAAALRLVPEDPPSVLRARLLALHARVASVFESEVEAERSAREALQMAELLGDQPTVNDAEATLAGFERRRGDPEAAARLLQVVIFRARRLGDVATEVRSRYSLASLHHEIGDLAAAQADFEQVVERAAETGRPWESFGLHSRAMVGLLRHTRGNWSGARTALDTSGQRPPDLAGRCWPRSTRSSAPARATVRRSRPCVTSRRSSSARAGSG